MKPFFCRLPHSKILATKRLSALHWSEQWAVYEKRFKIAHFFRRTSENCSLQTREWVSPFSCSYEVPMFCHLGSQRHTPARASYSSAPQQFKKSASKLLIFPAIYKGIADGVQTKCNVVSDIFNKLMRWMVVLRKLADKTENCHEQQRDDTEKAHRYHNGESASASHFALHGGNSLDVARLFFDRFSVPLGHNEDVAVRA